MSDVNITDRSGGIRERAVLRVLSLVLYAAVVAGAQPLALPSGPEARPALPQASPQRTSADPPKGALWIIPHTLKLTNLSDLQPGGRVNVEFDLLAKYVERMLAAR